MKFFTPTALIAAALVSAAVVVPFLPGARTRSDLFALEVRLASTAPGNVQVYPDSGAGASEVTSARLALQRSDTPVLYRVALPQGSYRSFRIDPIDRDGTVTIESLRVVGPGGRLIRAPALSELIPIKQIQSVRTRDGRLEVDVIPGANDPQLAVNFAPPLLLEATRAELARGFFFRALSVFAALAVLGLGLDRAPRVRTLLAETAGRFTQRPGRAVFRRTRHLLLALVGCAALYAAMRVSLRIVPAHTGLGAKIEGHFTEGKGWFAGEPFLTHRPVRAWGSWDGSDENTGSLTVGPFPAPARLRFAVGGYPPYPGNVLRVERVGSNEQIALQAPAVGERWRIIDQSLPDSWYGQPIQLVAIDQSKVLGGWLALTEPVRGGVGDGSTGLWQSLTAWAVNGVLLGVLWLAVVRALAPRRLIPAPWLPLVALGVVAALAYATFWAYFAHPTAGIVVSLLILLGGFVVCGGTATPDPDTAAETGAVAGLMLLIGLFYLALLHLLPSSLDFYELAANRFRSGLPTDNELPHLVASRLYAGEPLRRADADWLSSDRPPLQSGWQLLTWPVLARLEIDPRAASGTAGFWLQLGWIAAACGLLRALRLSRRRAAAWVAVIATSGFFLQNTTFTWPKLSAAAFACGAFGLWVLPQPETRGRRAILVGAGLAALAWLSHGGVAFSFLALAPWILWRGLRGEWREWLLAALVFGGIAAPWVAYQKFHDPPGNRLLKWHLGGQIAKDARGTWQTIRENYAALSWPEIWAHKRQNFEVQVAGRPAALVEVDPAQSIRRREEEFFYAGRALTWWVFGLALFPLVWKRLAPTGGANPTLGRMHLALLAWTAGTIPLVCLLHFTGGQAVVHQSSYATMLTAFVLLSAWFDLASRRCLLAVALLQTVTLATTWTRGNPIVHGSLEPVAFTLALLSGAALAAVLLARGREEYDTASPVHPKPTPAAPPAVAALAARRWVPALPWIAAALALAPAVWCARPFADLWWFGDDWDLLDHIQRAGFWRWALQPFAENFVPLFKVLWGGLVFAGGGAYWPMIAALWLTHALNTALFARLLRTAGFGLTATGFAVVVFGLAAVNIETLAWSVQWSALLAITFFLFAAQILVRRIDAGLAIGWPTLLGLFLLSAASALAFSRGVLTGGALAAISLLPLGATPRAWPARLRVAAACLLPAVAVTVTIMLVSPGNLRSLGGHWRAVAEFGLCNWAATPLHGLLASVTWHWPFVLVLGAVKFALILAVFRGATSRQRVLLVLLLVLDLGNAVLLGIGRHHTGLPAANGSRYYYNSLLCMLPFLALAFSAWLRPLPTPRLRLTFAAGLVLAVMWHVARGWPEAAENFAAHRGRNTRELLLRHPNPPAENAVPGIPFLPTRRARELIEIYRLH
ncbi:MAG: hypothetical protein HY736_27695 [Verrucomicrobia bacterium]|nr:hypothetical protein [Verrucomicrobiota bacterium]